MHIENTDACRGKDTVGQHFSQPDDRGWMAFNKRLDTDAASLPNESSIEKRLDELMDMPSEDEGFFWLTLARITELALKQAGDYADNCEFQAAGDLLLNPRRIDIYRRGFPDPVVKRRHGALSDQFAEAIGGHNPVDWLSRETTPRIRLEALLPFLEKTLASSAAIHPDYLMDLRQRMCKVADTIGFLMAWPVEDSTQLYRRLQAAEPDEKAYIASKLCRFDSQPFDALGAEIESHWVKAHPVS
jgi:hypothetical protein